MRNEQIFLVKSISGMIADADYVFFINYAGIHISKKHVYFPSEKTIL